MSAWAVMMLAIPAVTLALSGVLLGFSRHDRLRRERDRAQMLAEREARQSA